MRTLYALAAVLYLAAPSSAQCRSGGYAGGYGYSKPSYSYTPTYSAPTYHAPTYSAQEAKQEAVIHTQGGTVVALKQTAPVYPYGSGYPGYHQAILTLPGTPTTEVFQIEQRTVIVNPLGGPVVPAAPAAK